MGMGSVPGRIRNRLLYSYWGIAACGILVYALMQIVSLVLRQSVLRAGDILRIYLVISIIVALFLAVSTVSLIRHEGYRLRNLVGMTLGAAWVMGNLICLGLLRFLPGQRLLCGFAAAFGCYVDFLLTGVLLLAFLAARHKPAYDKDFAIILGCSISKQGGLLPLLKARTNRAIRFAWDQERAVGKSVRYVPTGGQGPDEVMSEGSAMELYLLSHGAEQYEVLPEKKSVNTYENLLFSKRVIDEDTSDAKTCFVTTNYHVLRSGMLARKAGLDTEGLASTTKWYFWPNGLAREIIAIFSMYPLQLAAAAVICIALTIA